MTSVLDAIRQQRTQDARQSSFVQTPSRPPPAQEAEERRLRYLLGLWGDRHDHPAIRPLSLRPGASGWAEWLRDATFLALQALDEETQRIGYP